MKKTFICFLSMLLLISLCACNSTYSGTVTCPSWNTEQSSGATFCQNCGTKINGNNTCASCGTENSKDASFCKSCGESLSGATAGGSSGVSSGETTAGEAGTSLCVICAENGFSSCKGHECLACNGKGYSKCYICKNGTTSYGEPCDICDGGVVPCFCDNGVVYYDNAPVSPSMPPEEDEPCSKCEGSGYVVCSLCEGEGTFGTTTVGGFDGGGSTEIAAQCPNCHGKTKVQCPTCWGTGTSR